jgi:hypothetical protein
MKERFNELATNSKNKKIRDLYRGINKLFSAIHKLINSVWKEEELPDQCKECIIVPIHKKGDKIDCNFYHSISLLSTSYKMLSNIPLSKLSQYIDEIIWDNQCGFQCNRSTVYQIFCIRQILEKNMGVQRDSISAIHRLQESL